MQAQIDFHNPSGSVRVSNEPELEIQFGKNKLGLGVSNEVGPPGRTPVRGVDYWTVEDIDYITENVMALVRVGAKPIYYDTTANWNEKRSLISETGAIYIYSDYETDEVNGQTIYIPGIRIGDGSSYLIDLPFLSGGTSKQFVQHLSNTLLHVSDQDREFWNNKVTAFLNPADSENLILSKT